MMRYYKRELKITRKGRYMKKMNIVLVSTMLLTITAGACEFTITNDMPYNKIYIAFNSNLANIVSENTLKTSPGIEQSEEKKEIKKENFSIAKNNKGKTPFTKWFDVFVPLQGSGQFERRFRVKMHYCSEDNNMTLSQIKNKAINEKRFTIVDFQHKHEAAMAHTHCPAHAPGYEHERQAKFEQNTELTNPGISQLESIVHPFGDKELLP